MGIGDLSEVCKLRCIEYRFASIAFVAFDTQHKSRMPRLLCWCRWWFRMPPSAVLQRVQTIFRVTSVACHRRRAVRARPLRHMPDIMYQKGGLGVFRSVSVLRQVNLCRKVLELFFSYLVFSSSPDRKDPIQGVPVVPKESWISPPSRRTVIVIVHER